MTIEVALLLSFVSVAFSIFFGLKNSKRTDTKDIETRVAENTRLNLKLDEIATAVNDIKVEMRLEKQEIQTLVERMVRVEASSSQAHKRLDRIEGKEDKYE